MRHLQFHFAIPLIGLLAALPAFAEPDVAPVTPAPPTAPSASPATPGTPSISGAPATPIVPPKKPDDHRALIYQYRKDIGDPASRKKIVEQVREMDEHARADLRKAIEQELSPKLHNYQKVYSTVCAAIAVTKAHASGDELRSLRDRLNAGLAAPTHESITNDLDPILAKLTALLQPSLAELHAKNPQLKKLSDELNTKSADWQLLTGQPFAKLIDPVEAAAQLDALAQDRASTEAIEFNFTLAGQIDAEEYAGTLELNRIRLLTGRTAMVIDPRLTDAARDHSREMKEKGYFSHESPTPGKKTPWQRAALVGTSASGENIAAGASTGLGAINMWWHSPGHLTNMMGGHRRVGLGRCEALWTQMLGG